MKRLSITLLTITMGCAGVANADLVDFSGLNHGDIVGEQYASMGLHISAINPNRPFDLAVAFDSTLSGTRDRDLEGPWSMGNIDLNTDLGRILIIQENDDIDPDDEGSRPAGELIFDFDNNIQSFGFAVVDLESSDMEASSVDFYLSGALIDSINFSEFESGGAHDNGTIFGNNSINEIGELSTSSLFDRVILRVGGSMGFDNISYTVPAPGSLAILGFGCAIGLRRRRG